MKIRNWVSSSVVAGITLGIVADRMAPHRIESQQTNLTRPPSRRVRRRIIRNLGVLALLYICTCVYFRETQVHKILAPLEEIPTNPKRMGMDYEPVSIPILNNDDKEIAQLNAFWVPVENPEAPAFLYLHGQDATRGKNLEHTERFHHWGWNVLVIDYRGFGESYGDEEPSESKVFEDALAALKYLRVDRHIPTNKIFVYGHSLGGAVAIDLATKKEGSDTAGLIVESTFTSIQEMSALRYYGFLHLLPISLLLTEKFDSLDKISSVKIPILFIHGLDDKKVPFEMSERLHAKAGRFHPICLIDGAGHENCGSIGKVKYHEYLDAFVTACINKPSEN